MKDRLPSAYPLLRNKPKTWACALTFNLLVHGAMLNQVTPAGQ